MDKPVVVISGEEPESEDEDRESKELLPTKGNRKVGGKKGAKGATTQGTCAARPDKKTTESTTSPQKVKVVTFEDEPPKIEDDSDNEEEFGSSVSLNSSINSLEDRPGILRLDSEAAAVLGPILPQRTTHLDPLVIKKHREKNRSLRVNITEKFLTPVILQSARKLERLSQNLSNSQLQMQDALFQSRLATGNMLKLQKHLEIFLEDDYLKELQILPTDEDVQDLDFDGTAGYHEPTKSNTSASTKPCRDSSLDSTAILNAALTRGAHLI